MAKDTPNQNELETDIADGVGGNMDTDIDDIEDGVDRDKNYDHEAASEAQSSPADLHESSIEIARRIGTIREGTAEQ